MIDKIKPCILAMTDGPEDYVRASYVETFGFTPSSFLLIDVNPSPSIEWLTLNGFIEDFRSFQMNHSEDEYESDDQKHIVELLGKPSHGNFRAFLNRKRNMIATISDISEMSRKDASGRLTVLYDIHLDNRDVLEACAKFILPRKERRPTINLLCFDNNLYLRPVVINFKPFDLATHYGNDFMPVHAKVLEYLNENKKSGLMLFHGQPGTGKTFYLRHLLSDTKRELIYIPSHVASKIANPEFLSFMMRNEGSVLVIEDAELILQDRESGDGAVSNLLNLTDGLLGDALKCQVICTFNIEKAMLDQALLRKGRLLVEHYFDKLSVEDSRRLMVHLGNANPVIGPMTLAEIYNSEEITGHKQVESGIGFATAA